LSENYKNFYIEHLNENFTNINSLFFDIKTHCDQLQQMFKEISTKYKNELPQDQIIKMANFCLKATAINNETLSKLVTLSELNTDLIIFMKKHLILNDFKVFINKEINSIPIYAKSVNELQQRAKECGMKINSMVSPVFNRAKACRKNENAFILVNKKELEKLKGFNFILKEPVNFPIWEIGHYKDITFKNGKGEGIFSEFTPNA